MFPPTVHELEAALAESALQLHFADQNVAGQIKSWQMITWDVIVPTPAPNIPGGHVGMIRIFFS
jgi:hypothetical protein